MRGIVGPGGRRVQWEADKRMVCPAAPRVDIGDAAEVEENELVSLGGQLLYGFAENDTTLAQGDRPAEIDDGDITDVTRDCFHRHRLASSVLP
jgi:hypothetical protein